MTTEIIELQTDKTNIFENVLRTDYETYNLYLNKCQKIEIVRFFELKNNSYIKPLKKKENIRDNC